MIPQFLIERYGPKAAKLIVISSALVAILLIGLAIYLVGRGDGKAREVVKSQQRTIETQQKVGTANENAAGKRVDDTLKGELQKKEISDAVANATSPDDARRRRGCVILRQQGRDTASIPACR